MHNFIDWLQVEWKALTTGGGIVATAKLLQIIISTYKSTGTQKALQDVQWIYEKLDEIKSTTGATCVWVGQTSNGGGIPRLGHNIYHSVLYCVGGKNSDLKNLQHTVVDNSLAVFLTRLVASQASFHHTKLIRSILGETLENWGVSRICGFHVRLCRKRFYYLGIGFEKSIVLPVEYQQKIIETAKLISKRLKKS